ncbi:MAG: hypothetical protein GTO63_17725 [Anaerolineae bacterium]|nr:hypothetical protein [Anaerolineae bacterium]NIN96629.1 hypothetical protein [Anaerolineae bacterium]NIQ79662.1 hypothetical protein [Anaerolineae bacterium]
MHDSHGADERQLLVKHLGAAVSGETELDLPPEESVGNMRVLDALVEAARSGKTVVLSGDCPGVPDA